MSYLTLTPTNLPKPIHAAVVEPILMRVTRELEATFAPPVVARFAPERFQPVRCAQPAVYGVSHSPRARMRHDDQLGIRPMPIERYEHIRRR